jgi:signal transduction histidine kinase
MRSGTADQEQVARPRLVPQSNGYAAYEDQSQAYGHQRQDAPQYGSGRRQPSRAGYAGHRRKGHGGGPGQQDRTARQRSIRSTLTMLLVLPLVSLIALWVYAASSTLGGALAKRGSDTLNKQIGTPTELMIVQLETERSQTFAWQSAHPRPSRTALTKQRALTDAAVAAFRAGVTSAAGLEPAADKPAAAALLAKLSQLAGVRTQVDAGTITPLAAFQDYNATEQAVYPFVNSLFNPQESLLWYQESQAALQNGEAVDAIGQEAALVGGAFASGGTMPADIYQQFTQTVGNQRLFESLGNATVYWQLGPDPYLPVFGSPAFASLQKLENKIIAAGPGARLTVSPAAWQAAVQSVIAKSTVAAISFQAGDTRGQAHDGDEILLRLILVGGAGFLVVILSSFLLLRFGNRIRRELTGLRGAARTLAHERLPSVVARLRAGSDVDVAAEAPPLALGTRTREVTETADAFSAVSRTAVEAAVEQARLRNGVSLVFRSLARRNQSLLQRQLRMLDEMERGTEDADALDQLFRLDHLTTRMRRQAEGLIILSGASPGRVWRQPVPVVEVMRGAIGEIEDYARVDLVTSSPDFLQGPAVADLIHMLAELVENAVQYSPPGTRVEVRGSRVANGYCIEVEDRGLGIPLDTMSVLNERLARPPEFDLADSDQLGLFVVSRLAARHGVKVSLRISGYGGTTAIVLLPRMLAVAEEEVPFLSEARPPTAAQAADAKAAGAAAAAALAGRRLLRPERALEPPVPGQEPARDPGQERGERPAATGQALPSRVQRGHDGDAGLPRRQAGANMAPRLRENPSNGATGPLAGRSAEQARALMSAIQQGLRSGRGTNSPQGGGPHGGPQDGGNGPHDGASGEATRGREE